MFDSYFCTAAGDADADAGADADAIAVILSIFSHCKYSSSPCRCSTVFSSIYSKHQRIHNAPNYYSLFIDTKDVRANCVATQQQQPRQDNPHRAKIHFAMKFAPYKNRYAPFKTSIKFSLELGSFKFHVCSSSKSSSSGFFLSRMKWLEFFFFSILCQLDLCHVRWWGTFG